MPKIASCLRCSALPARLYNLLAQTLLALVRGSGGVRDLCLSDLERSRRSLVGDQQPPSWIPGS